MVYTAARAHGEQCYGGGAVETNEPPGLSLDV
jgi:hypothetical protein